MPLNLVDDIGLFGKKNKLGLVDDMGLFEEDKDEGILSKIVSGLSEPGRVFKEEVTQGFNTLKDLVTQERPTPTREELMSPDISVDVEGGINKVRQGLGALAQMAFAPGSAFTKPILGQPTYKGLKALGVPEEWAKGTSEAVETLPYFLMGGQMIKAPKGLEISKRYGITPEQMQKMIDEAAQGGIPKADYLALPPGQGFGLVGKPVDKTLYTKNAMPENIPVPEQKLLPPGQGKIPYRETAPAILKGKELPQDIAFIEEKIKGALETKPFARTAEQKALLRTTFGDELYTLGGGKKFKEEIKKVLPAIKELLKPTTPERAQEAFLKKVGTAPTPVTQPIPESVKNVMDALMTVERLTPKQKALYTAERGKRIQEAVRAGETVGGGEAGYYAKLGKLRGELPKIEFETLRGKVTQQNIEELFNLIEKHPSLSGDAFDVLTAQRGLVKVLGGKGGFLPAPSEIAMLRQVFPKEFIDTLMKHRPLTSKLFEAGAEVLNLPRAIMASFDLSAPLRQGVFLIGRPKQFLPAFKDMFKYAFNEKAYQGLIKQIQSRPTYPAMKQSGLQITDIGGTLAQREERFMSNLGEKIPIIGRGIHASNRAYTGFLNKLRADVFDDILKKATNTGALERNSAIADDISRFINSATGRGSLGELNKSAIVLNSIFFSPKLMASRLNLMNPAFYIKLDPMVRMEALKSLVSFGGIVGSILGLASLGGAKIGIDPRNADFGKIKIGDTRYDLWGGFQQYMVLASRLASGKMVMSTTGKEYELGKGYKPTTRKDIIIRFLESKENPALSFVTKLLSSEKNINKEFRTSKEVIDRFIPMLASDIYDLYYEKGAKGIPAAIPGAFGVGVQTYGEQIPTMTPNDLGRLKRQWLNTPTFGENISNLIGGKELSNIPEEQWGFLRANRKAQIERDIQREKNRKKLADLLRGE